MPRPSSGAARRIVEHADPQQGAQDPADHVVESRLRYGAGADRRNKLRPEVLSSGITMSRPAFAPPTVLVEAPQSVMTQR